MLGLVSYYSESVAIVTALVEAARVYAGLSMFDVAHLLFWLSVGGFAMAASVAPIFPKAPRFGWGTINNALGAVAIDGTSGTVTVFTAGVDGSRVDKLIVQPTGTNVKTVLRIFLNNGSTTGTAANNSYIKDFSLPATTSDPDDQIGPIEIPMDLPVQANHKILVGVGTAVGVGTNNGYQVTAVGGDY